MNVFDYPRLSSMGGGTATLPDPNGYVYLIGNASADGSIRINGLVNPPAIEKNTNGQWNETELKVSDSTLYLGDNLKVGSAGSVMITDSTAGDYKSVVGGSAFSATGTNVGFYAVKCKNYTADYVAQSTATSVSGTVFSSTFTNSDYSKLVTKATYKTGSVAASAPVALKIFSGTSNAGQLLFSYSFPKEKFPANSDVVVNEFKNVFYAKGYPYFIEFSSTATFSMSGASATNIYRKINVYNMLEGVLSLPAVNAAAADLSVGDIYSDGTNINIKGTPVTDGISLNDSTPSSTGGKLYNSGGTLKWGSVSLSGGSVSGSGTTNKLAKFSGSAAVGDSVITELNGNIGINKAAPTRKLDLVGDAAINDGTQDRLLLTSTTTKIASETGKANVSLSDTTAKLNDGTRDRLYADTNGSFVTSQDGTKQLRVSNTGLQQSIDSGTTWSSVGTGDTTSVALNYLSVQHNATQVPSTSSPIYFATTLISQGTGISYSNGIFTVNAGLNVELVGHCGSILSSAISNAFNYSWSMSTDGGTTWNKVGNVVVTASVGANWQDAPSTQGVALHSYKTTTSTKFKLLPNSISNVASIGGGGQGAATSYPAAIIREIPSATVIPQSSTTVTEWASYTPTLGIYSGTVPTLGSGGVIKGLYRVIGKTLYIKVLLSQATAGTAGGGTYTLSLPTNVAINTALAPYATEASTVPQNTFLRIASTIPLGVGTISASTTNVGNVAVIPVGATTVALQAYNGSNPMWWGNYNYSIAGANTQLSFTAEIPIL